MSTPDTYPLPALRVPAWQPWTAVTVFALLLHFAWEMLQFPLFVGMSATPHGAATRMCLEATLGDAVLSVVACAGASLVARSRLWVLRPRAVSIAVYMVLGFSVAMFAERISTGPLARWSYADAMPTVLGIGLAPVLQWIAVPPLILWLARVHVAGRLALERKELFK